LDAATMGLAPNLVGLTQAGTAGMSPEDASTQTNAGVPEEAPGLESIGLALAKLAGNHPDPAAREAYERGRASVANDQQLAQEQHPWWFLAGQLGGSLAGPTALIPAAPELGAAGRLAYGAGAGAVGGAAYGAGSEVGKGGSLGEVARGAARGGIFGGLLGGAVHGAVGPRPPKAPTTPGQRAAQTAEALDEPLARGVASDSPHVQSLTGKAIEVPFAGAKISQNVQKVEKAAGEYIGDTATGMSGGTTSRAAAGARLRPAVERVIERNKRAIDAGYNGVRARIDPDAKFTMPNTQAAIEKVAERRRAAGWTGENGTPSPYAGFEELQNMIVDPAKRAQLLNQARNLYAQAKQHAAQVAGGGAKEKAQADKLVAEANKGIGASFNGIHRARRAMADKGKYPSQHPGYDAADFRAVRDGVNRDLREIVLNASSSPQAGRNALAEFDRVEAAFEPVRELNDRLQGLVDRNGEGLVETLVGAAREKGGDVRLLQALRGTMSPSEYETIGGQVLSELGHRSGKVGEDQFSLAQFASNWDKLSPEAKRLLFSHTGHLENLEDIFGLGKHIGKTLELANKSHTGGTLIAFDTLKTAVEGAIAAGAGAVGPGELAATAVVFAAANIMTRILASPKGAASSGAFARTWRAAVSQPSPARIGAVSIAARNFANTVGLDPKLVTQSVMKSLQGSIPGKAEGQNSEQKQ
jgi:hypothetical protein